MKRRLLSILLALTMLLSMVPVSVFATDSTTGEVPSFSDPNAINYVSIGDSMTNGYGFEGYNQGNKDDLDSNGNCNDDYNFFGDKNVYGEGSYALQFAEWLEEEYGEKVNHTKLGVSALRAEDLNYLLGGREMPEDGWFDQVLYYSDAGENGKSNDEGDRTPEAIEKLSNYFVDGIEDADIITMGIGNASFGAYMLNRVTSALGAMGGSLSDDEKVALKDALLEMPEEEIATYEEIYAVLKTKLVDYVPATLVKEYHLNDVVDIVAYTFMGFLTNYKGVLEQINELNPDAEIILVGLMNTLYGMNITAGDVVIPFGDAMGEAFAILNAYIAGLPAAMQATGEWNETTYYYAEQPEPLFIVQAFDDLYAANWNNIDCGDPNCVYCTSGDGCENGRLAGQIVRSRQIDAYNSDLRPMISAALNNGDMNALPPITIEDLNSGIYVIGDEPIVSFPGTQWENYDSYGDYSTMSEGPTTAHIAKYMSVAVYLAIEESVAKSVDTMDITLEGLLGITGDIFAALGDMPEELTRNPGPWTIKNALVRWFTGSDTGKAMCKVYGLFKIGDGMSVHPTPAGHDNIFAAVRDAYTGGNTVQKETIKNLKEAYATAYDLAYSMGKIAEVQGYMDVAIDSVKAGWNAAMDYVPEDAALDGVKKALMAEYGATINTLVTIRDMIGDPAKMGDYESAKDSVLALESELWIHLENLKNLGLEIGFVADPYIADAMIAAENYSDLITQIARDTFDAAVEAGAAFADEYYAWVDEVSAAVALFDQDLAAAVKKFLTETPEEGIFIMGEYGSQMLSVLVKAAIASEYVYTVFSALGYALAENGEDIYNAIATSENAQILLEQVLALKDQLLAHLNISDIYHYDETLNTILGELTTASCELLKAVVVAVYAEGNTDSEVAASIGAIFTALNDALVELGEAGEYGSELTALVSGMGADLLAMLVENGGELDAAMISVYNQTVNHVVTNLAKVDAKVAEVVGYVLTVVLPEIAETVAEQHDQAWIVIQGQLDTLMGMAKDVQKTVGEVVAELNQKLDQLKNHIQDESNAIVSEVETALNELKALLAQAEGLSQDVLDEINAAIAEVEAALNELKKVIAGNFESIYDMLDAMAAAKAELLSALNNLIDVLHRDASNIHGQMIAQLTTVKDHVNCIVDNRDAIVGEIASWLLEELVEALPTIDAKLYEFFYNNPDMVISFFEEYGEIFAENYEVALVVLGYIAYTYGPDAAEWVMENPEEACSQFVAWYEAYGDKAWEMVVVYLAELGIIDAIEGEINNATVQVKAAADKLCQILTGNGEALKAELDKIAADTQKQIEELEKQLDDLYAQLENAVESDKATILAQIADVQAKLDALNADLYTKLMEAAAKVDAELPGKIQAAYNALVDALVAAAKEYGAEVDQWLYDYLYENPAKVIGFFMEYGDNMVNFLADYTEEIVTVLGALVLYLGDDVAEFVMNYPEEIFAAMVQWAETYGEETWAMILVYLNELGVIDAAQDTLENAYAQLTDLITAANGQVEEAIASVQAQIEAQIKKLEEAKAALEAELVRLQDELKNASGEAKDQIDQAIAQVEKAIEAIENSIDILEGKIAELVEIAKDIDAAVQDVFDAIAMIEEDIHGAIAALQDALRDLADAIGEVKEFVEDINDAVAEELGKVSDAIDAIVDISEKTIETVSNIIAGTIEVIETVEAIIGQVQTAITEAADALEDAIETLDKNVFNAYYAVLVKCEYGDAMTYVALGGATVADGGYVEAIGEYIEANQIVNAGEAMAYADQAAYVAKNAEAIADAGFITYQMDANEIVRALVDVFIAINVGDSYTDPDWAEYVDVDELTNTAEEVKGEVQAIKVKIAKYLDDETLAQIAQMEAEIIAKLEGMFDEEQVEQAKPYVEHLVYKLYAYAVETSDAIDAVKAANSEAPVVLVGMYNTLNGVCLKVGGQETDLGEFFQYVIDVVDVYNLIYAIVSGNVTFVDVSEAAVDSAVIDVDAMLAMYAYVDAITNDITKLTEKIQNLTAQMNFEDLDGVTQILNAIQELRDEIDEILLKADTMITKINAEFDNIYGIIANTANEEGHAYIAEQIKNALIIVDHTAGEAVRENVVDATCKAEGSYDEVVYCSVCGEELSRVSKTIDKTGHAPGEAVKENVVEATCEDDGSYDEVVYCSVCGEELSRETKTVAKLGHSFTDYVYNDGTADCTNDGTEIANCDNGCGTWDMRSAEGTKLEHEYIEYIYNDDASCNQNGTETAYCEYGCGTYHTREAANTKLEHSYTTYVYNEDATCQTDGTETASCDHGCGDKDTRKAENTKLEHSYTTYVSNGDATCFADGTEFAECDYGCGTKDARTDEGSKLTHSFTTYTSNGDATCFADGAETAYCDHGCGATDTRTDEGSKLTHSFTTYTSNGDATCFNDGTETAICDNDCGFTDTRRDEGSKLGHSYSTYTSNGDATCVADGTETAACDHGCGFTDTRRDEGSKLDHVFTDYKSNEDAKCLVDGTETATCDLGCGTKDTRTDEGSKLGHQWDEGVVTTEPTATKNGIITYTCSGCQATKTEIAAKTGVIRVYGADRYKTAFKAADTLKETLGIEKFEYIVVASGTDYADALSGSYLANQKNAPILLVRNRKQELNAVKEYINANLVAGGTVYLLGGEKAMPKAMESGLDGFVVKRLAGATRYETNLEILKEAGVGTEDILVATGKDFADSLSASAVNKPILLVKDNLNDAQKNFLSGLSGNKIYIIGGNNAVHTRIENALKAYGSVTRIGGATRYDTSVNIAKEFFPNADSAVLVYGKNFPDGLTGGVLASKMNAPVVLAAKGKDTQAVKYITTAGIKTGAVMGGTILISDGIVKNAFSMGNNDQIIVK